MGRASSSRQASVAATSGLLVHLTNGIDAASGTVASFMVGANVEAPEPYTFGDGLQLTKGNALGVKVNGGAGTVAGYFTGDYVV